MNVALKSATEEHWDFILSLRNTFYDNFDKQNSPLTKTEHYEYLKHQSSNPKFYHWIITLDNKVVGYVRLLESDVGIMLMKNFQNKGIASYALNLVETEAKKLGISKLVAKIRIENIASRKIFEKNNYKTKFIWLEKVIE